MLNNLWENKITKDDFSLLKSHFLSKLQINLLEHPWNEATYIVPWNELKDMINRHMIEYHSKIIISYVTQLLPRICIKTNLYVKTYNST
jgi:hypothetical protein